MYLVQRRSRNSLEKCTIDFLQSCHVKLQYAHICSLCHNISVLHTITGPDRTASTYYYSMNTLSKSIGVQQHSPVVPALAYV
jgi:hypothetical protein